MINLPGSSLARPVPATAVRSTTGRHTFDPVTVPVAMLVAVVCPSFGTIASVTTPVLAPLAVDMYTVSMYPLTFATDPVFAVASPIAS